MSNKLLHTVYKTALTLSCVGCGLAYPISNAEAQSTRGASPAQRMGTTGGADRPVDGAPSERSADHSANGGASTIDPQGSTSSAPTMSGHSSSHSNSSSSSMTGMTGDSMDSHSDDDDTQDGDNQETGAD